MSRETLAKAAGIAVSTLSDLELDRSQSSTKLHRLAERLGVRVEWLETGKGAKASEANNVHPTGKEAELRPELVIARLQNDVDSLRYVLAAMVATMTVHRPTEASDVAKALRNRIPSKFRDQGFAHELASVLERAARPETAAPAASRARANPRSSRPK